MPEIKSLYTYDEQGFLKKAVEGGSVYQYERDTEGNTQRKAGGKKTAEKTAYSYDKMNRLTGETRNGRGTVYRYDLAGNRISRSREGNEETYRYNRNTGIKGNDFLQKNTYDAEGYRSSLKENGEATYFTYSSGMLLSEQDGEDIKSYVLGNEYVGLVSGTGRELLSTILCHRRTRKHTVCIEW